MATREQRIRKRLFPDVRTYDRELGGFTALPLMMRRAQFLFNPRKWQIYTYILMRTGPAGIAWLTLSEMSWDLDFRSVAKLKPYVDELVRDGWVCRSESRGRDYYILPDPWYVLDGMRQKGDLSEERIDAIDELLELLGQETLSSKKEKRRKKRDSESEP